MSKWTISKLKEVEDRIAVVKGGIGTFIFNCIEKNWLKVVDRNGAIYSLHLCNECKCYDHDMKLIEPPKERKFHVIVECMNNQNLKTEFFSDSDIVYGYTKLPNGRKYKRYVDNGELEVME